jgi:predicted RNA binding protein YcfA (HicA-like mRNA interferase family)
LIGFEKMKNYFANNRKIAIFAWILNGTMKSKELHNLFLKAGWTFYRAVGSHYIYIKDGVKSEPVPFHGSKEMGKGLALKLIKKYNL